MFPCQPEFWNNHVSRKIPGKLRIRYATVILKQDRKFQSCTVKIFILCQFWCFMTHSSETEKNMCRGERENQWSCIAFLFCGWDWMELNGSVRTTRSGCAQQNRCAHGRPQRRVARRSAAKERKLWVCEWNPDPFTNLVVCRKTSARQKHSHTYQLLSTFSFSQYNFFHGFQRWKVSW